MLIPNGRRRTGMAVVGGSVRRRELSAFYVSRVLLFMFLGASYPPPGTSASLIPPPPLFFFPFPSLCFFPLINTYDVSTIDILYMHMQQHFSDNISF